MKLSARILGSTAVAALTERTAAAVLTIGRDTFTRGQLARVECFNYVAASNLTTAIASLKVKDTADLFDRIPPAALAVPHVGVIALAVLGAAFEARGIGGANPLESWATRHTTDERPEIVTFSTLKHDAAGHEAPAAKRATTRGKR